MDPTIHCGEILNQVAYGNRGLGNSKYGLKENIEKIDYKALNTFRKQVTPKKCVIVANGINDHDSFLSLVEKKLATIDKLPTTSTPR